MDRKMQTSLWLQSRPIAAIQPQMIRQDEMKLPNSTWSGQVLPSSCVILGCFFFFLFLSQREDTSVLTLRLLFCGALPSSTATCGSRPMRGEQE